MQVVEVVELAQLMDPLLEQAEQVVVEMGGL